MKDTMTDADIIESQPMDIIDDDKPTETAHTNGDAIGAIGDIGDPIVIPSSTCGKVIQVTNVSPGATLQQLATLFGFLGTVTDIRLYPSDENALVQVKVCFIKFENDEQCGVAQHLTNTVFIDKALIVVPIKQEEIPEENACQHLINSINAYANLAATGYLPGGFPVDDTEGKIPGLPPPPIITSSTDPVEIEEIKRTIFVQDIDQAVTSEQLVAFFSGVGEVKYMRISKKSEESRWAFIEFTAIESVPTALQYNGCIFGGKCLSVEHAKSPIVKPESERIAAGRNSTRLGRDVVRRPSSVILGKSRSRSRSRRSRSRGRTSKASRSPVRRSKPRSRSRSKSRPKRKSRSRTPPRRRSPIRSSPKIRARSRTRSPVRRKKSRSRTRSPVRRKRRSPSRSRSRSRKRSRSRSKDKRRKRRSLSKSKSPVKSPRRSKKKSRSRSKSKSRSPRRKSRKSLSRSPERSKKKKSKDDKKDRSKDKEKEKDKDKDKGKEKGKEKEKSPEKELKDLLDKVYTYEEEKQKEKKKEKLKEIKKEIKKEEE